MGNMGPCERDKDEGKSGDKLNARRESENENDDAVSQHASRAL
jgi:hypothetical protein